MSFGFSLPSVRKNIVKIYISDLMATTKTYALLFWTYSSIDISHLRTYRYRTNSMYWDREVSANSADQDQTASEEAV